MDKYNHLTNLFRSHFYQTVFEDFNSIDEIILDYKKDSSKNDWNLLVKDIKLIINEKKVTWKVIFDRCNCRNLVLLQHIKWVNNFIFSKN